MIIIFKSFNSIHTRFNSDNISIIYLNNSVCISSTFFMKTKQKAMANMSFCLYF